MFLFHGYPDVIIKHKIQIYLYFMLRFILKTNIFIGRIFYDPAFIIKSRPVARTVPAVFELVIFQRTAKMRASLWSRNTKIYGSVQTVGKKLRSEQTSLR